MEQTTWHDQKPTHPVSIAARRNHAAARVWALRDDIIDNGNDREGVELLARLAEAVESGADDLQRAADIAAAVRMYDEQQKAADAQAERDYMRTCGQPF